ncbi:MAG: lytic murein transglycosylase, partial [Pseudomonadota bacterium]
MQRARTRSFVVAIGFASAVAVVATHAHAAACGNTGRGFKPWLSDFKQTARANGISQRTIARTLNGLTYDRRVIRRDRSQRSFKLSFETFY